MYVILRNYTKNAYKKHFGRFFYVKFGTFYFSFTCIENAVIIFLDNILSWNFRYDPFEAWSLESYLICMHLPFGSGRFEFIEKKCEKTVISGKHEKTDFSRFVSYLERSWSYSTIYCLIVIFGSGKSSHRRIRQEILSQTIFRG